MNDTEDLDAAPAQRFAADLANLTVGLLDWAADHNDSAARDLAAEAESLLGRHPSFRALVEGAVWRANQPVAARDVAASLFSSGPGRGPESAIADALDALADREAIVRVGPHSFLRGPDEP